MNLTLHKGRAKPQRGTRGCFSALCSHGVRCYPLPCHKQRESLHLRASRWHPPAWEGA